MSAASLLARLWVATTTEISGRVECGWVIRRRLVSPRMPVVSVIVPARNATETITRTLKAVGAQDFADEFEVIVVDNGSDDDTGEVASAALPEARLIRKEPGGVGSARNLGVEIARSARIAFVDADCYPTRGWLAAGLHCLESADLVQGRVEPDPEARRMPFDRTVSVGHETGLYETANLFVRREAFERAGGFDDWLIPDIEAPFGEDVAFAWEAKRNGAKTAFCPGALAHHAVFPRTAAEAAAEQLRCEHFPALAARIPELRDAFFYRRWFLTRRSAAFDAALLGTVLAITVRSRAPLALALPYTVLACRSARGWGRHAPRALAGDLLADAVACAALAKGSVASRRLVL
jgi:glycosyltransferase involved in cell wall biosynthesis